MKAAVGFVRRDLFGRNVGLALAAIRPAIVFVAIFFVAFAVYSFVSD
jgi:hypothetical protein